MNHPLDAYIGRLVLLIDRVNGDQMHAAIVTNVLDDETVNLTVFRDRDQPSPLANVRYEPMREDAENYTRDNRNTPCAYPQRQTGYGA